MLRALILIGGKSTRMGQDKYLLDHHGKPQYLHLLQLLSQMDIPSFLSCRKDQPEELTNHPVIVDQYEAHGPMGGIASAFREDKESSWLVLACDMPNVSEKAIRNLIEADDPQYDVVCYQKEGEEFFETAFAIYHPSVFPKLKNAIDQQELSLQKLLRKSKIKSIYPEHSEILRNVNTPKDLH